MNMRRTERLTSQHTGGEWHARYPTGLTTLCGLPVTALEADRLPPTCPVCVTAALFFDRVDQSAVVGR